MFIQKHIVHVATECIVFLTAALLLPTLALAQAFNTEMNLAPELQRLAIEPSTVKVAGVVVTDSEWKKKLAPTVLSHMYTLSASAVGSTAVSYGVKISYNPIRMVPIEAASCTSANGVCTELEVSGTATQAHFTLDHNTYTLNLYGEPCVTGFACDFYVSSWQLHRILEEASGRPGGDPKILAALDTPEKILLLDVERKSTWLAISKQAFHGADALGSVRSLRAEKDGRFVIGYDRGHILVDLLNDVLLLMSHDAIYVSSRPIAGMHAGDFDAIVSLPPEHETRARALYLDGETAVWSSHYVNVPDLLLAKSADLKELPETFSFAAWAKGLVRGMSAPEGMVRLWELNNGTFKESGIFTRDYSMRYYRLAGDGIFFVSGSNTKIMTTEGTRPTSLDNGYTILMPAGGAVVKRDNSHSCLFAHLLQNETSPAAFKDSGIYIPCAEYRGASQTDAASMLFGFSGSTLKVRGMSNTGN